ncbi:MAG: cytidylate kinase [Elusimicrobia bacterium CG06_land_8_20_14_3_00_38_11]|nr:MAG: cytidylate kinase [Elusimicrobia bacterium CG06_land_8_20_14_3_00_38_11]
MAIDGPAGAGKSAIAKIVAKELGYLYIDTGAMYRAITWKSLANKIDFRDEKKIIEMSRKTDIKLVQSDDKLKIFVDGKNVSEKIREEFVTKNTNTIAAIQGVRKILRDKQRLLGRNGGVVMEGRDIGTAVFPDAEKKFYLDAKPKERAVRRWKELKAKGKKVSLKKIAEAIKRRDYRDRHRGISPLKKAKDAIVIDSTGMTLKQVAENILSGIRE